ncbi:MAG: hypothetical protein JSW70_08550 [Syntrophobacterales bacterium]|nr:MAG: hypothetical protein JSW70_08550 [Syntrophobacterales bacterium]
MVDIIHSLLCPGNWLKYQDPADTISGIQKGYITGETLRDYENPSAHIVISTWESVEDWTTWSNKEERLQVQSKIEALLTEPSKIKIYELIGVRLD